MPLDLRRFIWPQNIRICAGVWRDWLLLSGSASNWIPMIKIHCFFSAAGEVTVLKGFSGKGMDFSCFTKGWITERSAGPGQPMKQWKSHPTVSYAHAGAGWRNYAVSVTMVHKFAGEHQKIKSIYSRPFLALEYNI